jgi:hypothetical protein
MPQNIIFDKCSVHTCKQCAFCLGWVACSVSGNYRTVKWFEASIFLLTSPSFIERLVLESSTMTEECCSSFSFNRSENPVSLSSPRVEPHPSQMLHIPSGEHISILPLELLLTFDYNMTAM